MLRSGNGRTIAQILLRSSQAVVMRTIVGDVVLFCRFRGLVRVVEGGVVTSLTSVSFSRVELTLSFSALFIYFFFCTNVFLSFSIRFEKASRARKRRYYNFFFFFFVFVRSKRGVVYARSVKPLSPVAPRELEKSKSG